MNLFYKTKIVLLFIIITNTRYLYYKIYKKMNDLHEQLKKMKSLILSEHGKIKPILTEQEIQDKVLLDGACKKWKTMSFDEKKDFTNNSVEMLNQDDPIDMDVVCQAADDDNFEEAIPTEEHRKVIRLLVSPTV